MILLNVLEYFFKFFKQNFESEKKSNNLHHLLTLRIKKQILNFKKINKKEKSKYLIKQLFPLGSFPIIFFPKRKILMNYQKNICCKFSKNG